MLWRFNRRAIGVAALMLAAIGSPAQQSLPTSDLLDEARQIVKDNFHDPNFNGVDWPGARERCRERLEGVASKVDMARELNVMLDELKTSHTRLYVPNQIAYYELLDIYREGLGDALKQFFPQGVVRYAGIGVLAERGERGLLVTEVYEASPAASAGIVAGDVLIAIDDGSLQAI